MGNVAAAGQQLQGGITELLGIKTHEHREEIYEHHMQFRYVFLVLPIFAQTQPLDICFSSRYTLKPLTCLLERK